MQRQHTESIVVILPIAGISPRAVPSDRDDAAAMIEKASKERLLTNPLVMRCSASCMMLKNSRSNSFRAHSRIKVPAAPHVSLLPSTPLVWLWKWLICQTSSTSQFRNTTKINAYIFECATLEENTFKFTDTVIDKLKTKSKEFQGQMWNARIFFLVLGIGWLLKRSPWIDNELRATTAAITLAQCQTPLQLRRCSDDDMMEIETSYMDM
jgi:hypothetical protein